MKQEILETPPSEAKAQMAATKNPIKKLYYWTLQWAETKYALPALIILSFAESSFFPIPPDVLLLALCFSRPQHWLKFAFWCTAASVAGGVAGYYIGWGLWETVGQPIVAFYHGEEVMEKVRGWYDEFGFLGIVLAAVTPIPYKVFTIASGTMQFDLLQFIAASAVGRGMRFFAVAILIRYFGARIKPFFEKHFEIAATVFGILGIGGILAIKLLR